MVHFNLKLKKKGEAWSIKGKAIGRRKALRQASGMHEH